MTCACCCADIPFEEGKRNVCTKCGADFGYLIPYPIHIRPSSGLVDMAALEAEAKLDSAMRLLEFVE